MKYLVVIGDGMADYPLPALGGRTPLQAAEKPFIDGLSRRGVLGLARTVPEGMAPGSDTANLSVMGYDPRRYHSGRSPFEAAGMGVEMSGDDVSFRCNLVTLSGEGLYAEKIMFDYSAGEISTAEARPLVEAVSEGLDAAPLRFYPGTSYRHLMIWPGGPDGWSLTPPHDILGQGIAPYLPVGPHGSAIRRMMEQSAPILSLHPLNRARVERGLNPANSIWIWGAGRRPRLPSFSSKYGLRGAVISAVDLVRGIGRFAGLELLQVEGATGTFHTNYRGKAQAALEALREGADFVYIHIEAPDECSHQNQLQLKVESIERIDSEVVGTLIDGLEGSGWDYRILIMPDHYTPLSLRTHTDDPVPFLIYTSGADGGTGQPYDEHTAASGIVIDEGNTLMDRFIGKR